MSTQTGLRDLGRNNASEWRGIAAKKGAAPSLYRTAAKSTASSATVHATFISPPRNPPTVPNHNPYHQPSHVSTGAGSTAAMPTVNRAVENENWMARGVHHTRPSRSDYSLASGAVSTDLEASFPSGVSEPSYPTAVCDRGSGLRSVSDVPVLSMGSEEEQRGAAAAGPLMTLSYARGPVTPMPVALPTAASFIPGATSEDDLVAAFLGSCRGCVAETACTPHGKALLVAALETEREEVLVPVVAEVCESLCDVAVDAHGCHVLRTLVEACTAEQTEKLIAAMYPSVLLNICTTSQHTRLTLQSLFERRVVDLWPVVNVLAANAGYLAATQQGCISLMRVFERCDVEQKSALVHELLPKFAALSMDAFANYMVQCAVEHSDRTTAAQYVVQFFSGHLLQMSCDKFASNVVEKMVRVCGGVPAVRRLLLDELIFNPAALKELVSDGFGNFVVQSVVEATTNAMELKRVEDRLRPALVGCPFAAKIEAKLKAKRPGTPHTAVGGHHQPQQQQQRRASFASHNALNVYGIPATLNAQISGQVGGQRPSSYRMDGTAPIAVAPVAAIHNFRHRPYDAQAVAGAIRVGTIEAVQRFHDTNAHLCNAPVGQTTQAPSGDPYALPTVREGCTDAENEVEDCGPVYGPSPAARRHLQQHQQQFRPPFTGAL